MDKTPAELEAENQAAAKTDGGTVDNQEPVAKSRDEMMSELKEKFKDATPEQLLEKLAEKEEIIFHKNRAIESEKKKKAEIKKEEVPQPKIEDDLDKPLTKRELLNFQNAQNLSGMVNSMTQDENERKAITEAYEKDIVKTGDLQKDLKKALAIANIGAVEEYRRNRFESENRENQMTRFSGGQSYGSSPDDSYGNNAVKKATAENLRKTGTPEDKIKEILKKI